MHKYTPIKSHIVEFTSIFNELDKIEVKIEDEEPTFLLLCSLPSSYKSFREAIIHESKSIIKISEVKEHLVNKDKIERQFICESHHDYSRQAHFTKEKINNESSTSNSKYKNLICN